ncbi:TonB-dependent receptor domain-containing protein [Phenylobacterium terrae]|uniref:TonB-dependent receptor domain-containing protein n=1 Tax=Phenylobacterium terrae TaxID=2665495 RepID=A0ABW4N6K6_9CAUL
MRTTSNRGRLLASSMLMGAMAAALAAAPASAQDTATEVGELVVTGSRIVRPNLDSPTPVTVATTERLENQGMENISDALVTLPQFAPSFGGARTQSTFSGTASSGLNVVNLRNLGSSRSLVLINGRRAPSGTIFSNAVDLNTIPSANISRIDIMTGGASAVYGADAVSGVVNIITDKEFEGFEAGFSYGAALEHHDNINPTAFARFGANFDRGHAGVTVQYDYQGLVSCRDRFLCAEDFAWSPPAAPRRDPGVRSGVPLTGRYFVEGAPASSYTYVGGAVVPFTVAAHGYNRNATRTLAIPTERIMVAADADFELTEGLNAFVEINYGSSETDGPFEAHPFSSDTDLVSGVLEPSIPSNYPFFPAELAALVAAAGDDEITWWQRFEGLGARGSHNLRQTTRLVAGVEGDFDTLFGFGSDWRYEASYVWGRTTLDAVTEGLVARDALYHGLRVEPTAPGATTYQCVDAVARAQGCIPINPFDGYNDAERAYLVRSGGIRSASQIENALAFLSGSLFELPAGPFQATLGVESRRITAYEDYSTDINLGLTTGNQISDSDETTFTTDEIFTEVVVPILRDMPFANELTFEGAYRWSDANIGGKYETWKYGLQWAPIEGLRFRAMQNRAVRAPVLGEVTGISQTFGVVDDPCILWGQESDATLRANCQAAGVPANYDPPLTVIQGVTGFVGGNPDLMPEVADTLTYGFVLQAGQFDFVPEIFGDLTITVDRFEIEMEGLINTIGRQNIAQLCYTTPTGQREIFCNAITRGTDPAVPGANYVLTAVDDQLQNIASLELSGVDLEVNWGFDWGQMFSGADNWGRFSINSVWTFYDKVKQVPLPGQDPIDFLGAAGGSTSDQGWLETQGNTTFTWQMGNWKTSWVARYIGEAKSAPEDLFNNVVDIDDHWYHDISLRVAVTDQVEAYGGITNLFDQEPPFFPTSQSGTQALDTIPAYYDVMGRSAFVGVKVRF